jgi:predicted TPR repeat methyltransferase
MPNPRVNPAILISPVEGGFVAYDPKRDYLHELNPVAALITELCDGSRSAAEIKTLAGPLMPEGKADLIDRFIEDSVKVGLLAWEDSDSAAGELSAPELITITKRLREIGNVQAAYLCGKRTVELVPENWDAWYDLGEIAQCVGKREEARAAYQLYFDHHPEDSEIAHLLIALKDEAPPPRASDQAITHIYKSFAASYDTRMRDDLKYVGPERLMEATAPLLKSTAHLNVLDLGCGSGFASVVLKPMAAHLTGLDLSPEMVALAKARNLYDHLEVAEITSWLENGKEPFDLIFSSDCIIYFGDISRITAAASGRLKPGAVYAFSMELGKTYPFQLTDTGRYTHHPDHVRAAAAKAGLTVARLEESFLRMEWGEEVTGLYAVLVKPEA